MTDIQVLTRDYLKDIDSEEYTDQFAPKTALEKQKDSVATESQLSILTEKVLKLEKTMDELLSYVHTDTDTHTDTHTHTYTHTQTQTQHAQKSKDAESDSDGQNVVHDTHVSTNNSSKPIHKHNSHIMDTIKSNNNYNNGMKMKKHVKVFELDADIQT